MMTAWPRWTRSLALIVGAMDTCTGAGLVAVPRWTLQKMGIVPPGNEALEFVRFVGVFVGAVGLSYLVAWIGRNENRLRRVFEFTLLFRAGAGAFTGIMVVTGRWAPAWLMVSATDLGLVILQGIVLVKYRDE